MEDRYDKKNNMVSLESLHEIISFYEEKKVILLNNKYYVSEWSWSPMFDGIDSYEEIIRSHLNVEGIDVYFTNKNYRFYLKEDLYDTKEECRKICKWKNSFAYDYECYVSRQNLLKEKLSHITIDNEVVWSYNK